MSKTKCPQCQNDTNESSNRLIQDTCGHKKCRMCLVQEETGCKLCYKNSVLVNTNTRNNNSVSTNASVITYDINSRNLPKKICGNLQENIGANCPLSIESNNNANENRSDENCQSNKIGSSQNSLPNHVTVLSDSPVLYKCTICQKSFSTTASVKYHKYCAGIEKPLKCEICDKGFISRSHLETHKLKHSGVRPFSCSLCQKSFMQKSKLNRHMKLHTGERPFVCSECGKNFTNKDALTGHHRTHSGDKPFCCKYCGNRFNNKSNLTKHLMTHTKEKLYMCEECGKKFSNKWALISHGKCHTQERPYTCQKCSKSFTNIKDLRRHGLIHLGLKPYSCKMCSMKFCRKDNLERHLKNTHSLKNIDEIKSAYTKTAVNKKAVDSITGPKKVVEDSVLSKPKLIPPPQPTIFKEKPNAINVIKTSNKATQSSNPVDVPCMRNAVPVINGPFKLAFKTDAFKNNYNILNRDYTEAPPRIHTKKPYDRAESLNICQKILLPMNSVPLRAEKVCDPPAPVIMSVGKVNQRDSLEICKKILVPNGEDFPEILQKIIASGENFADIREKKSANGELSEMCQKILTQRGESFREIHQKILTSTTEGFSPNGEFSDILLTQKGENFGDIPEEKLAPNEERFSEIRQKILTQNGEIREEILASEEFSENHQKKLAPSGELSKIQTLTDEEFSEIRQKKWAPNEEFSETCQKMLTKNAENFRENLTCTNESFSEIRQKKLAPNAEFSKVCQKILTQNAESFRKNRQKILTCTNEGFSEIRQAKMAKNEEGFSEVRQKIRTQNREMLTQNPENFGENRQKKLAPNGELSEIRQKILTQNGENFREIHQKILTASGEGLPEIRQKILTPNGEDFPEICKKILMSSERGFPETGKKILSPNEKIFPEPGEKILAPNEKSLPEVGEKTFPEIDKKILSSGERVFPELSKIAASTLESFPEMNNKAPPLHYETSFEHKKHADIKNIKFKLPAAYTNSALKTSERIESELNRNIFKNNPDVIRGQENSSRGNFAHSGGNNNNESDYIFRRNISNTSRRNPEKFSRFGKISDAEFENFEDTSENMHNTNAEFSGEIIISEYANVSVDPRNMSPKFGDSSRTERSEEMYKESGEIPLIKPVVDANYDLDSSEKQFVELQPMKLHCEDTFSESHNCKQSVIVNPHCCSETGQKEMPFSEMHWRRRTSLNLHPKLNHAL